MARTGFALLIVGLLVGTAFLSLVPAPARAASVSLTLVGSATSGWGTASSSESNPGPTLTVSAGDSVTITLTSSDGFPHEFLLDYNGNGVADTGEPVSAQFTTHTVLTFVADRAGTFSYICAIHTTTMRGSFVVQGTGSGGSTTPSGGDNTLLIVGVVVVIVAAVGMAALFLRKKA